MSISPYLHRFISPDTIVPEPGSSGGFNRYRYTRNNPLRYTDPSGHCVAGLCPGQNVDYYSARMESSTGLARYEAAVALNAALASTPDREAWNTGSLRSAVANDAYNVAMKEGVYADQPSFWDNVLEDAAAAGISIGANAAGSQDNLVPNVFSDKQKSDIFSDGGWVSGISSGETQHTVDGSRPPSGGRTGTPNSIWEQVRGDGSRSVTYFDEQGRRFSREDYGQLSPHGTLGQDASGRTVPHEHRYNYGEQGPTGRQYRELDTNGRPIGDWIDD